MLRFASFNLSSYVNEVIAVQLIVVVAEILAVTLALDESLMLSPDLKPPDETLTITFALLIFDTITPTPSDVLLTMMSLDLKFQNELYLFS